MSSLEQNFKTQQFIAKNIDDVFKFFSEADNLEKITPPWLNFRILKTSTSQIQAGTLIDYQLRIHGLPMRWRTKIEVWQPPFLFRDIQLKGPYAKWQHTHRFIEVEGGTQIIDEVVYRIPGGWLGKLFASRWVKKDVETIFNFRSQKISEIFK